MSGGAKAGWLLGVKGKVYGLQKPATSKPDVKPVPKNVFSFDDEDEAPVYDPKRPPTSSFQAEKKKQLVEKQYAEALAQDSSVFEYDALYDDIQKQRSDSATMKKEQNRKREVRYIGALKASAEERLRQNQKLDEKRIKNELEAEQAEFGDTEKFLTSGYKKQLIENRRYDEEQRMLAEEEKKDDVVKKGNMNDFYSNLLKSNIAMGREIRETPAPVKEEKQEESESALDNYEGGTAPLDKYSALVDEEAGCDLVDAEAGVLAPALPGEIKEEAEIIKQEAEIAPPEGSMPSPPRKPRRTDLPEDMDYGEDGLLYQRMPWGYVLVDEDKDKRASAKRKTSDEVDAARARAQARAAERKKARLAAAAKK